MRHCGLPGVRENLRTTSQSVVNSSTNTAALVRRYAGQMAKVKQIRNSPRHRPLMLGVKLNQVGPAEVRHAGAPTREDITATAVW